MTGESVRDIGYLAWENKLAWIENMKGPKWQQLLRREKTYWNALTHPQKVQTHAAQFEREFTKEVVPYLTPSEVMIAGVIMITLHHGGAIEWRWRWSTHKRKAVDLDTDGTHVWHTIEDPKDSYRYIMTCETMDGTILWQKHDTSLEICVVRDDCYYIKLKYPFETIGFFSCNAYTGKSESKLLDDPDPRRFLTFVQGTDHSLFVSSGTWSESKTWRVEGNKTIRIYPDTQFQYPIDNENAICTNKQYDVVYHGKTLKSWILPPSSKYTIQWANTKTGHIVTNSDGEQAIWYCEPHKKPDVLFRILAGDITPIGWNRWLGEMQQNFIVHSPLAPPYILSILGNHIIPSSHKNHQTHPKLPKLPNLPKLPELTVTRHSATSEDGTHVSYALVHAKSIRNPRKLLAYVYGAYGSKTIVMWPHMHWAPLFSRGWAVAYSYPRGTGDRNVAWMREGQGINHLKTIQDFEAVIRHARGRLDIPASRTVIYGRSAGGLMVGGTTARNPDGRLMGATYTEVPFVDALRSQTNPTIPLVESGYSEYGNPLETPVNFQGLLKFSPMNALNSDGAPGVFVLCRTGLKDLQVLPFEPIKWIQRLRGDANPPAGKFLAYEKDEAHVYSMPRYYKSRAIDLAILDLWADGILPIPDLIKNRRYEYTMATLQQKKQQQKKQQKKQQQGGKSRRVRRGKSRRATRRHRKD